MSSKPHIAIVILSYALAALSIAAGIPKIMQMPQELQFLSSIGLSGILVSVVGAVQVLGGVLLVPLSTRLVGAGVAEMAFIVSSIAIFTSGNTQFGIISLLPIVLLNVILLVHVMNSAPGDKS
tara:strand:- start:22712 stop:23080 length:369 start_codon:yes stop_codon:yes gene_type:complete